MSSLLKFFRFPFGISGDRGEVPDKIQANGAVSYETGFGFDYERDPATDANAKEVPRPETNQLYYDITATLRQYQTQGVFPFVTPEQNGGAAYAYSRLARCLYGSGAAMEIYESLADNNTALPVDSTKWKKISSVDYVPVARKVNTTAPLKGGAALTGDLTLSIDTGGLVPTARKINTAAPLTGGGALAGDLTLSIDTGGLVPTARNINTAAPLTGGGDLSANRTLGISAATETAKGAVELATAAETFAGTDTTRAVHPAGLAARWTQGHGETGWQKLPSGLIFQWGKVAGNVSNGDGLHPIIFPIVFPGAAYAAHWTVGQGVHTNFNIAPGIKDLSTTGVTLVIDKDSTNSITIDMYWFAYGK